MLSSYHQTFAQEDWTTIWEAALTLYRGLERDSKTEAVPKQEIEEALHALQMALARTSDTALARRVPSLVTPSLKLIVEKMKEEQTGSPPQPEALRRGKMHVLVGLLYLHLLLPHHRVDPTAKYATKVQQTESLLDTIGQQISVRRKIEHQFTTRDTNEQITRLQESEATYLDELLELKRKTYVRPTPPYVLLLRSLSLPVYTSIYTDDLCFQGCLGLSLMTCTISAML